MFVKWLNFGEVIITCKVKAVVYHPVNFGCYMAYRSDDKAVNIGHITSVRLSSC